MPKPLAAYLATLVTMLVLDGIWLGLVMGPVYKSALGPLLLETPRWGAAVLFYALYVAGVVLFAVWPGIETRSIARAALLGAAFGFVAYATYDLTNLATLKDWSVMIVALDLAWGLVITAASAAAGCWAGSKT